VTPPSRTATPAATSSPPIATNTSLPGSIGATQHCLDRSVGATQLRSALCYRWIVERVAFEEMEYALVTSHLPELLVVLVIVFVVVGGAFFALRSISSSTARSAAQAYARERDKLERESGGNRPT